MYKRKSFKIITLAILSLTLILAGCSNQSNDGGAGGTKADKPTLIFADAGWDSIKFHNAVAAKIIEEGYGYTTDVMNGSTPITFQGLVEGDIDIYMENWTTNLGDKYQEAIDNGKIKNLSLNFGDNAQGFYVPAYLVKGPDAPAPDLKTVQDLEKYWELFKDPEDPSKGRIHGSVPGWEADVITAKKVESYGLDDKFNYFRPGSDTALSTSIVSAYEAKKPWVGYYWEPTWILGKYDMVLLEEAEYSDELWEDGYKCEFPAVPVTVDVHKDMLTNAPDVVDFLKNYKTSSKLTSEAVAYMLDHDMDAEAGAKWFFETKEDIWTKWIPADVAEKVKNSLK